MARARSPQTLDLDDRRAVAGWAADCAERVLDVFESRIDSDGRPRALIARARAFAAGQVDTAEAIRRRFEGGVPVAEVADPAAMAAARSAGQASAVCHMGAHALGAAAYAVEAAALADPDRPDVVSEEVRWQRLHMTEVVRSALSALPLVGTDRSGPLGPGLMVAGRRTDIIRALQEGLDPGRR